MQISIRHTTTYNYDLPAVSAIQQLRLTARDNAGQRVQRWRVIGNDRDDLSAREDAFGNIVHSLTIMEPHNSLQIKVIGDVLTKDTSGVLQGVTETVPPLVFLRPTALTQIDDAICDLAAPLKAVATVDPLNAAHQLMANVRAAVAYVSGKTDTTTTAAASLALGAGVCQDHTHLMIAGARVLDFPARYVSGYLVTDNGSETNEASHAWAEILIPSLGWVGFDAANQVCPNERYVRVSCGLDYQSVAPVAGVRRGQGGENLTVDVSVTSNIIQNQG